MEIFTHSGLEGDFSQTGHGWSHSGHYNLHLLPESNYRLHAHWHPPTHTHTLTHTRCCDKRMHSSHCPCSRTYIKTTVWTSKIKLHLPVWDTLITLMSVGIQSKSKLCPTKTAPLISSPIKSISCPRAYFRQFISLVASSNRPYSGLPSRKVVRCDVCLSGALCGSLMPLCAPRRFPTIARAPPSTVSLGDSHRWLQSFVSTPGRTKWTKLFRKLWHFWHTFVMSRSIVELSRG